MASSGSENKWKTSLREQFPEIFDGARVLDVGSADINGDNRAWFEDAVEYIGLDVAPHDNVDVVSVAHKYKADNGSFRIVCSTSALEHDMYFKKTLKKMSDLTCSGGLMFFSACNSWPEHGTNNYKPEDSLTTKMGEKWANYYHNLTANDLTSSLDLEKDFYAWRLEVPRDFNGDLRFWGIKR